MAYNIRYSDQVNKGVIVIEDNTLNAETSLSLPGRNTTAYGQAISENFLHLLENFAHTISPTNPTEGQLWYDTTPGVDQLKLYDGTTWVAAGGLKKANLAPEASNSVVGDLWVDTDNQQLYLFAGSNWLLVGPEFAEGLATGTKPVKVTSTTDAIFDILQVEIGGKVVAIMSKDTFIPKTDIEGFDIIKPGYNLSTEDITGDGIPKYLGTAEKAENLVIDGAVVPSTDFMRKSAINIAEQELNIKNDGGISVGLSNSLRLRITGQAGVISHDISGSSIDFKTNNSGVTATPLRINSNTNIGINNLNPEKSLDVGGDIQTDSSVIINGLTDSTSVSTGSLILAGGAAVAKNLTVGAGISVLGNSSLNDILPQDNNLRSIGSTTNKWKAMYATEFVGSLNGNVQGSVSGRAGSADKLSSPSVFRMTGDVESLLDIDFDGQQGTVTFQTQVTNEFISAKTIKDNSQTDDEFLVNRVSGEIGIYKVRRSTIFDQITGLTPVGTIAPYAGATAPDGWLLCHGQNELTSAYEKLSQVIGNTYDNNSPTGYFSIPDLRGRLPLGADNMGGTAANIVPSADTLGAKSGTETTTITVDNLPDHKHELKDDGATPQQYYVINPDSTTTGDSDAIIDTNLVGTANGLKYPRTGGMETGGTGDAVSLMNPYLTVNYIIYTGVGG
jgi:microcystin-dependent protein